MSDEESFVILGTSPMQSLEQNGTNGKQSELSSLQSDAPGSCFSSLRKSQVTELQSARESLPPTVMRKSAGSECSRSQMETSTVMEQSIKATNLWATQQAEVKNDLLPASLEDGALKSPLKENLNGVEKETANESLKNLIITAPSSLNTPQHSLNTNGIKPSSSETTAASTSTNTLGSHFTSLKNSQIMELQSARESCTQTPPQSGAVEQTAESKLWSRPQTKTSPVMEKSATATNLWSIPQVEVKDNLMHASLEDYALKSPLKQSLNRVDKEPANESITNLIITAPSSLNTPEHSINTDGIKPSSSETSAASTSINTPGSSFASLKSSQVTELEKEPANEYLKNLTITAPSSLNTPQNTLDTNGMKATSSETTTASTSANTNLASRFIMGDVNADVLKTSVYSQFPSISMEACAEDVVKLQNMVIEYMQLKNTLDKVNNTMKLFYTNSMQWKEKMNQMENHYKEQLNECQTQIEMLRKENQDLKQNFEAQVEQTKALDVARQKDREDTIQEISEKNAVIENMRAQIVKLEKQQLATFEFIPKKPNEKTNENFDDFYVTRGEHELIVKDLRRELSELLASNLDFKDVEKQYVDELNCLKVNLTSAEEIIKQNRAEIAELRALDLDKQKKIDYLETSNNELRIANSELNDRVIVLEQQNEVHRNDFEMERQSRETAVSERHQVLQDLRALQKKNQDLIEERQKLVQSYEKRMSSGSSDRANLPFIAAAAAAQTYFDNPQRPIRDLTPPSPNSQSVSSPASLYRCPVCNKGFKSLNVLQSHVNDCIDKN